MLVIYMITALLFLTSVDIHIHNQEAAATADHGMAVDISSLSLAGDLLPGGSSDEITVSPESVLKVKQTSINLLAVFLLIAVMITVLCRATIDRLRENHSLLPVIPFHGTPPLRAPPL